ncbi:Rossmann fold nucleotide-binding protein [Natronomonas halophila]|uniref:SLOG cluster 4 domain-containing protein n=1 Tax=Natronomonas halophila TaxID=2747817 RepID=UPI0015B64566|nr:Rossmann fold nucleotide-binding protein [Natronomonas halophila]QLD86256.1 Rossmann fold nucleotide-binding protein [Natronomonas halophila]
MRVSVIGGSSIDDETYARAREVGRLLGTRGHTVVCGGLGGTMEAVCKGAHEAGGPASGGASSEADAETIGILPTERPGDANEWVTTPIATGMGNARNVMVVLNGDAAIAIDGAAGTLSELGHALDFGRPIAGLDTHDIDLKGFEAVETPKDAVEYVEAAVSE